MTSYHWATEDSAVMFAMRNTRNNDHYISVYDPDGFMIVSFEGRRYFNIRSSSVQDDIWNQLASEARQRKSSTRKKIIRKSK